MSHNSLSWLPDWRTTADYPDPDLPRDTISCRRWKWEFLRRNPDYQRDWAKATAAEGAEPDRELWLGQYGLKQPHDPTSNQAPTFVSYRHYFIAPRGKGERRAEIILQEGKALVEFDLEQREATIDSQWESIRWHLIPWLSDPNIALPSADGWLRLRLPRRGKGYQWQPGQWLKYLRILDANESKAEAIEIGSVLYTEIAMRPRQLSKRIYDDWMAARDLRDFGYRRIR